MTNPVAAIRTVQDGDLVWDGLMFICPGCKTMYPESTGLHMLPVNHDVKTPAWTWNGNLEKPTLSPSILTKHQENQVCHSFLTDGVFEYLSDCTHMLAGHKVSMVPLEDWMLK